jgi:hypothetical protein
MDAGRNNCCGFAGHGINSSWLLLHLESRQRQVPGNKGTRCSPVPGSCSASTSGPYSTRTPHARMRLMLSAASGQPSSANGAKCPCWRPTSRWRFASRRRRTSSRRSGGQSGASPSTGPTAPVRRLWRTCRSEQTDIGRSSTHSLGSPERLSSSGLPHRSFDEAQLSRLGTVVAFDSRSKGYRNKHLTLRWSLFDATTERPLLDSETSDPLPAEFLPTTKAADVGSWEVWVANPHATKDELFVRLEFYEGTDGASNSL